MKKRIVSLLLSLALVFALLPTQTFALKAQVSKMTVEIAAPKAGAHPSYTATLGSEMYTLREKNSDGYTNGIQWRDMKEGRSLSASDTFEEGRTYRVYIQFSCPTSSEILSDAKCLINSKTAERVLYQSIPEYYLEFTVPVKIKTVSRVDIEVTAPKAGAYPDYNATVKTEGVKKTTEEGYFYKNGVCWRYGDLDKTDVIKTVPFKEGVEYYVCVQIVPQDGYEFATSGGKVALAPTINGKTADISYYNGVLSVSYTFPPVTESVETKTITHIDVTVTAPGAGKAPVFDATVSEGVALNQESENDYYYKNGVCWRDAAKEDVPFAKAGGVFEKDKAYYVSVSLKAKDGYVFARNGKGNIEITATLNGKEAEVSNMVGGWIRVNYYFPTTGEAAETKTVTHIDVTVTAPEAGKAPVFDAKASEGVFLDQSGANSYYYKNGVCWRDADKKDVPFASAGGVFEDGKAYYVAVALSAKDGYAFARDTNGYMTVTATLNGKEAEVGYMDGGWVAVRYTFPKTGETAEAGKTQITKADFTFTPPKAGDKYYDKTYKFNSQTTGTGQIWIYVVENDSGKKFEGTYTAGNKYLFEFWAEAAEGYAYAEGVEVTVNGEKVTGTQIENNGDLFVPITVESLPAAEEKKKPDAIKVTVTAPKVGEKPVFTAVTEGAGYEPYDYYNDSFIRGVAWSEDGDYATMQQSDKTFEPGKTYSVLVAVRAKDGYTLDDLGTAYYSLATVNGNSAKMYRASGWYMVEYVFPPLSDAKTVTEIDATFTLPKPGDNYDRFGVTVKSEGMKNDAWRVEENGTGEIFEGKYTAGSSYLFYLTFCVQDGYTLPADPQKNVTVLVNGEKRPVIYADERYVQVTYTIDSLKNANPFEDVDSTDLSFDAVLWAYYASPQVTNGIDKTHFGPDMSVTRGQAVTFLWRAAGCPEPTATANPFVDVASDAYYFKPVLWAVEKGVTNGTDATHFTPDQTCSTAHIITFLYRARGVGSNGWYEVAQAWAAGAGLLKDVELEVAPGVLCPRSNVVLFLYRVLGK